MVHEQVQPDRVEWRLPMVSLIPDESTERLQNLFGKNYTKFNANEVQALATADLEGAVDNARMRQICGAHAADITRLLQGLVAKGALIQHGQGRWSRYRLPDISGAIDSIHKGVHSVHKAGDSVHKDDFDDLDVLMTMAAPAREKRRLETKTMEQLILTLCRNRWLTRRQLADVLQRHPDSLRSRFLTSMVAHGLLRLKFPDKPNRTDQAYTTKI